ncbi:MAG: DUF1905 domain-containing protein [Acidobacteria bacterium]|nr:DUF1905 domain-containing protein [Acidobacteriota bacterium]MBV9144763.1 DUF1905 domain-containing protein [Acidobacteriota bacterium]
MPASKSFRGTLEHLDSTLGWVIVRIPFDVRKTWGKSRVKVQGEVNGFSFRTTLFSEKNGGHFLLVNKKVQKGAHIYPGAIAQFQLSLDTAPREPALPKELSTIFKQSKKLQRWYENLSYSYRNYIGKWIAEPKSSASRQRRAEQMAERLLETMVAEIELPPLIQNGFAQNGKARRGWELMTANQRRGELMAIFYYRTPESRARRLQKVLAAAEQVAERKNAKQATAGGLS